MSVAIDWATMMKGKVLKEERISEQQSLLNQPYNSCNRNGSWDYRKMARLLNTRQLAEVLSACDPLRPSTEDKLSQVNNLTSLFPHLAPALAYGGVQDALVEILENCEISWSVHAEALKTLRQLLEQCAMTRAGMDPCPPDSLVAICNTLCAYLDTVLDTDATAEFASGIDHTLEALFSLLRYRQHKASEAACWDAELAATLLQMALLPATAFGHDPEEERDRGLELYLNISVNILRVLNCMCLTDMPLTTMHMNGRLLGEEDVFESLKALMLLGCDLLYTDRYRCVCGDGCQEVGGALVRNCLAIVGNGFMWVPPSTILDLKNAGWIPVLERINQDRSYVGHYSDFFKAMTTKLLQRLPHFRGRSTNESMRFGEELLAITLGRAAPQVLFDGPTGSAPRVPSTINDGGGRRKPTGQTVGPDGQLIDNYEVTLDCKDYYRHCAHCKKDEAQLAAEAASTGQDDVKLRECAGCHRVRYCTKKCQKMAWPEHKAECKRYQRLHA